MIAAMFYLIPNEFETTSHYSFFVSSIEGQLRGFIQYFLILPVNVFTGFQIFLHSLILHPDIRIAIQGIIIELRENQGQCKYTGIRARPLYLRKGMVSLVNSSGWRQAKKAERPARGFQAEAAAASIASLRQYQPLVSVSVIRVAPD